MRLDEITKDEFVDRLKDPEVAEVKKWVREIDKAVNAKFPGGWTVEMDDPPIDFYADKYINITRDTEYRPSSLTLNDVFNIASEIISVPALHNVEFGYLNLHVDVDVQIDIAFGREGLYRNYSDEQLAGARITR